MTAKSDPVSDDAIALSLPEPATKSLASLARCLNQILSLTHFCAHVADRDSYTLGIGGDGSENAFHAFGPL